MTNKTLKIMSLLVVSFVGSQALASLPECSNDKQCLTISLALVRESTDLKTCKRQAKALVDSLNVVATRSTEMLALNACLTGFKTSQMIKVKLDKRDARIEQLKQQDANIIDLK